MATTSDTNGIVMVRRSRRAFCLLSGGFASLRLVSWLLPPFFSRSSVRLSFAILQRPRYSPSSLSSSRLGESSKSGGSSEVGPALRDKLLQVPGALRPSHPAALRQRGTKCPRRGCPEELFGSPDVLDNLEQYYRRLEELENSDG